jgi:hypothetical protein
MILTNCNCAEKIDCGCGTFSFDYYNDQAISVLEVGNLVSDEGCELEGYIIDWYLNGELALTTGVGSDPDIQAFHPFTGDAAIPVVGGTYVPVLRYFILDGEKIFTTPKYCQKWCEVEINLPASILVERLSCGSINVGGTYQYLINYISTDPDSLPSRRVAVDLPEDLSTKYFAIQFTGYDISDKVELYLNGNTLLTAWIVGNDCISNFQSLPYARKTSIAHKFVVELPAYQVGDYLTIVVTPAVIAHIPETNWRLYYKCLDNTKGFDCSFLVNPDLRAYDIQNWSFEMNPATCQREFRINLLRPFVNYRNSASEDYWFYLYGGITEGTYNGSVGYSTTNAVGGTNLLHRKTGVYQNYYISNYSIRAETYGLVNLTKSGNVFTFTFADSQDWQAVKDNYDYSLTTAWWTNREPSDVTDIKYYRWWFWRWKARPANCGDTTFPDRQLFFHHTSTVIFDNSGGVYTLTITAATVTNQFSTDICSTAVTTINSFINSANSMIATLDYSEDTLCFEYKPFGYGYGFTGETPDIRVSSYTGYSVNAYGDVVPCQIDGICKAGSNSVWRFYPWFFGVIIDLAKDPATGDFPRDSLGNYIDEPCENFSAYWTLDENGCLVTSPSGWTLILKVEDGVITYELPYENLNSE